MRDLAFWLGAAVAGGLSVIVSLGLLPAKFRQPPHLRSNYRGRLVMSTAGVVFVAPLIIATALELVGQGPLDVVLTMFAAGTMFGLLGYLDDVYGSRHAGGFVGHTRELLHGRLTTGSLKALGGGIVGLVAAWTFGLRGIWFLLGGAVIALSANLANLLDVRPGRTLKVWLPCAFLALVIGLPGRAETLLVGLGGAAVAFLIYELAEHVMLGDTGAGLLGGTLGVAVVPSVRNTTLLVLFAVLVALTAASEAVSFTRVIEAVRPLRWADRLGRRG